MKQVFDTADLKWTREPATYKVGEDEGGRGNRL